MGTSEELDDCSGDPSKGTEKRLRLSADEAESHEGRTRGVSPFDPD